MNKLLDIMLRFPAMLESRDSVIDLFVKSDYMTESEMVSKKMIRKGKIYLDGNQHKLTTKDGVEDVDLKNTPKLSFYDKFVLTPGVIANHTLGDIETTCGLFLLNQVVLVRSFNDAIPYINEPWDIGKIESKIAELVIDKVIEPSQVMDYIDNIHSVGGYNDFCVPALSEKSITSNKQVIARKKELLAQYKDQLDDPVIMLKIENELVAMDKEQMKGDVSTGFLISSKNYDVQRKRMFGMLGMVESFGDESTGYNFGHTDLNNGWKADELDILANDIRRGSYNRAKSTAKGGAESKFLGRTFQESRIVEDDCGATKGLNILISDDNANRFINRTILEGKKQVLLTKDNISSYIGKTVVVRSPMFCRSKFGYCYTCMDARFKSIGIKLLNILPIQIGSNFLDSSMKSMHGKKMTMIELANINEFLI